VSNPRWRALKEGRPVLIPLVAVGLVAIRSFPPAAPLAILAAAAAALAFRDPERAVTPMPEAALAPADGRVIHIQHVWDPYWKVELIEIGIFLALWDVHVQRTPLDGEVAGQQQRNGGCRPAMSQLATHDNNQVATYLRTPAGPCVVTQISGFIARRIVTWVPPGSCLTQGQRLGMIKFGSQVTLRVPLTMRVVVGVGDRVRAGMTPVAELAREVSEPG
jgi:phosphatidylserine decarboxylase